MSLHLSGGSATATGTGTGNAGRRRGKREKLRKGEKQEETQQGEGVDDKNNNSINVNNNAQTEDQRASHQPNYDHGHDSIPTPAGSGRPSDVVPPRSTAPTALPSPDRPAITIDPAALSHPARLPMNYNVQPSDVDVDIEAAAMLMTDFQSKAAASVGSAPSASGALPDTPSPASLTPGMGLLNPPGPGSSSSLNMTMGSMLNLSPVVGNKRERPSGSLSPGPALPPLTFGGPSSAAPTSVPAGNRGLHESSLLDYDGRDGKNKRRRTRLQPKQTPPSPRIPDNFPRQIPQIQTDEQYAAIVEAVNAVNADDDNLPILPETFSLPSLPLLNAYLSSYFTHYHPHLPFLHIPTFVPHEVQPALLLSILSLGSLFTTDDDVCTRTHDVEASLNLHVAAKILISRFLAHRSDFDSRLCPLWALQSTLLNMIWGSWSGDAKGLEWSCSIKSLLANLVSGGLYTLKRRIEVEMNWTIWNCLAKRTFGKLHGTSLKLFGM
ncbi:hypothetical protein KEM55_000102, partial [Ascosphaera atra]